MVMSGIFLGYYAIEVKAKLFGSFMPRKRTLEGLNERIRSKRQPGNLILGQRQQEMFMRNSGEASRLRRVDQLQSDQIMAAETQHHLQPAHLHYCNG
ncbi:hypothetical protein AVEN_110277-1 [Araneus ventricosus]|uniref:Uncharacterized protein n=1 Tax=Araneus ventricosus TaxID=182803 RepID=A0A4Y2DQU5_ARAVE|nr:hypothetical protein AVEN_110277-1 [Araneus ventricosus]